MGFLALIRVGAPLLRRKRGKKVFRLLRDLA